MGRGRRNSRYESVAPARQPHMRLAEGAKAAMRVAEDTKAVMRFAEDKPTMRLDSAAAQSAQEMICDLQRAAAAQGERLRRAEQELASTQGRLRAATRKLNKEEAAAERAERAQVQLAAQLGLCRRELAKTAAALREKDGTITELRVRLGEKDAAAEGLLARAGDKEAEAERSERALRELAATAAEKDATIEELRVRLGEKEAEGERAERARSQAAGSAQGPQQELPAAGSTPCDTDEQGPPPSTKQALAEAPVRSPRAAQIPPESGVGPADGQPGTAAVCERLEQWMGNVPIGGDPESTGAGPASCSPSGTSEEIIVMGRRRPDPPPRAYRGGTAPCRRPQPLLGPPSGDSAGTVPAGPAPGQLLQQRASPRCGVVRDPPTPTAACPAPLAALSPAAPAPAAAAAAAAPTAAAAPAGAPSPPPGWQWEGDRGIVSPSCPVQTTSEPSDGSRDRLLLPPRCRPAPPRRAAARALGAARLLRAAAQHAWAAAAAARAAHLVAGPAWSRWRAYAALQGARRAAERARRRLHRALLATTQQGAVLGSGAYGVVRNEVVEVVTKRPTRPDLKWELAAEAETLKVLQHAEPHPGATYVVGMISAAPGCLVLEHCQGDMDRFPPIGAGRRQVARQLLQALAFIHRNHVVHLDLKPANMLISTSMQLRLADFGLATTEGKMTGGGWTPWWRPPEALLLGHVQRVASCREDLWAAGIIIAQWYDTSDKHPLRPVVRADSDQYAQHALARCEQFTGEHAAWELFQWLPRITPERTREVFGSAGNVQEPERREHPQLPGVYYSKVEWEASWVSAFSTGRMLSPVNRASALDPEVRNTVTALCHLDPLRRVTAAECLLQLV